MPSDKKPSSRLVPGAMYIPPTPAPALAAPSAGSRGVSVPSPRVGAAASSSSAPATAAVKTSPTKAPKANGGKATASSSSPKFSGVGTPSSSAAVPTPSSTARALTPNRQLGELVRSIEPRSCLHPAVEELLLEMATEFVNDVVSFSSQLAKHRRTTVLGPKDLQFCLAKNYGISLAGMPNASSVSSLDPLGADVVVRPRPAKNSLHMHRMALKRKMLLRTSAKMKKAGGLKATGDGSSAPRKPIQRKGSTGGMDLK